MDELLAKDELTTSEAAQILRVSPVTVWKWFNLKKLRGRKTSALGDIRIDPQSVIEFMRVEQGIEPAPSKKKK